MNCYEKITGTTSEYERGLPEIFAFRFCEGGRGGGTTSPESLSYIVIGLVNSKCSHLTNPYYYVMP